MLKDHRTLMQELRDYASPKVSFQKYSRQYSSSDNENEAICHLGEEESLDENTLKKRLYERFKSLDFRQASEDIIPFIKDRKEIEIWSSDFFSSITRDRLHIQ